MVRTKALAGSRAGLRVKRPLVGPRPRLAVVQQKGRSSTHTRLRTTELNRQGTRGHPKWGGRKDYPS